MNIVTNITTAQTERDRLEELVKNDALTGLRSRAYCNLEAERIEKNNIRPVCVISCDITGLKMVNDNLGHAAGDELLAEAATLAAQASAAYGLRGAHGGDEFVVLLPAARRTRAGSCCARSKPVLPNATSIPAGCRFCGLWPGLQRKPEMAWPESWSRRIRPCCARNGPSAKPRTERSKLD